MLIASSWAQTLLDGLVPAVGVMVGGAVIHRVGKWRQARKTDDAQIATRLTTVETDLKDLKVGLFGEETPFGRRGGFVDEVRRGLKTLVSEATPNGGSSMKDDVSAIRQHLRGESGE